MSSIPNSAMPQAGPAAEIEGDGDTVTLASRVRDGADRALGLVRDNPKTAIAAGAALAAGAAAAAAIPLVRAKRRSAAPKADGAAKAPARKRPTKRTAKKS